MSACGKMAQDLLFVWGQGRYPPSVVRITACRLGARAASDSALHMGPGCHFEEVKLTFSPNSHSTAFIKRIYYMLGFVPGTRDKKLSKRSTPPLETHTQALPERYRQCARGLGAGKGIRDGTEQLTN